MSSLALELNSQSIPLPDNISLSLILRSCLFDNDEGRTAGSFIFNFTLPAGIEIRRACGFPHKVNKSGSSAIQLPYKLRSATMRWEGIARVTEATAESYEIRLNITTSNLAVTISGKTLKDLDFGSAIQIADTYSSAKRITGYTHQINQSSPFQSIITINWNLILLDLNGSLNWYNNAAYSYTASADENIDLTINLICRMYRGDNHSFNVYINNTLAYSYLLADTVSQQLFNKVIPLSLNSGDVVTTAIVCDGEYYVINDLYMVAYDVFSDSFIEFSSPNIFDTVCQGNQDSFDYAVFPIENPEFMSNFPDDHFMLDNTSLKTLYSERFPVLNYYIDGKFPFLLIVTAEGETFFGANLFSPFVYFNTLIQKIAAAAGYEVIDSPYASTGKFANAVLFNSFAENTYSSSDTRITITKPTFNLVDHVPALNQSDFLRWAAFSAGCRIEVNDISRTIRFVQLSETLGKTPEIFPGLILNKKTVTVEREYTGFEFKFTLPPNDKYIQEKIKELNPKFIYKGPIPEISDLYLLSNPQINDYWLVVTSNEFYIFQYDPENYILGWLFFSKNNFLLYREGKEPYLKIEIPGSPVLSNRSMDPLTISTTQRLWLIATSWQAGTFEGFPQELSGEYGNQMTFYMGMQNDSFNNPYPAASPSKEIFDNSLPSIISLSVDNPQKTDIYHALYKAWIEWLVYKSKPVTYTAILSPAQLKELKINAPQRMDDGAVILIKELRVNILNEGLSVAEIDVYTV